MTTDNEISTVTDIPNLMEIYQICDEALQKFPRKFRDKLDNVLICVENFPDEDTLKSVQIKNKYDLLGLYRGIPISRKSAVDSMGSFPDTVFLYRCPLIRFSHEHKEDLKSLIRHVIIHEIGHHFGFSDSDMEWIEKN